MSWLNFLVKNKAIQSIYGDEHPLLNKVAIHEISISSDGPQIDIRFDLSKYPKKPPEKWTFQGFNKVQIVLSAIRVENLKIEGWDGNSLSDICIKKDNGILYIKIKNAFYNISFNASHLMIQKISAYKVEGLN